MAGIARVTRCSLVSVKLFEVGLNIESWLSQQIFTKINYNFFSYKDTLLIPIKVRWDSPCSVYLSRIRKKGEFIRQNPRDNLLAITIIQPTLQCTATLVWPCWSAPRCHSWSFGMITFSTIAKVSVFNHFLIILIKLYFIVQEPIEKAIFPEFLGFMNLTQCAIVFAIAGHWIGRCLAFNSMNMWA